MGDIIVNHRLKLPESEFEWSFVRSSGPGGQNVNRTNSCAVLRWNYLNSKSLALIYPSDSVLEKLKAQATSAGDIIIRSQVFRDQERNCEDCRQKLASLLRKIFHKPKTRIATKPTKASKQKRLHSKKAQGEKKALRRKEHF